MFLNFAYFQVVTDMVNHSTVSQQSSRVQSQLDDLVKAPPAELRSGIAGLFWQLVPLLEKQLQAPEGNVLFPLIIDEVSDEYFGVSYPVPLNHPSEHFRKLNGALVQALWQCGAASKGPDQIEGFAGYYFETRKPVEQTILGHLSANCELAKPLSMKPYRVKLGLLQPRYNVKELSALAGLSEMELRLLTVKDKVLNRISYREEHKRYYKPQAVLHLATREDKVLEKQLELIEMAEALPGYITPARWDRMRQLVKDRRTSISSSEIIYLFGSWSAFMAGAGHPKQRMKPAEVTKQAMLEYGKRFVKVYGQPPTLSLWLDDPEFPHPNHLKSIWPTFDEFLSELGYAPEQNSTQPLSPPSENLKDVKSLALRGWSQQRIASELKLQREEVVEKMLEHGMLSSAWIKKHLRSLDEIASAEIPGAPVYPKDVERVWMEEFVFKELAHLPAVNYLGLEGAHFGSYISLSRLISVNASQSLIAEWDERAFMQMKSIVRNNQSIKGGEIFKGINLYYGPLSEILDRCHHRERTFSFHYANLDYQGPLNQEKITTLAHLFEFNYLAPKSLLFITLNASQLVESRLLKGSTALGKKHLEGFPTDDQSVLVEYYVRDFARSSGYNVEPIGTKRYKSRQTPMLLTGYKVTK